MKIKHNRYKSLIYKFCKLISPLSILLALDRGKLLHLRVDLVLEADVSNLVRLKGHVRLWVTEDDRSLPNVDPG